MFVCIFFDNYSFMTIINLFHLSCIGDFLVPCFGLWSTWQFEQLKYPRAECFSKSEFVIDKRLLLLVNYVKIRGNFVLIENKPVTFVKGQWSMLYLNYLVKPWPYGHTQLSRILSLLNVAPAQEVVTVF